MSRHTNIIEALGEVDTGEMPSPDVPWPSSFELEVRAELLDAAEQQRRTNRVVMQLQLEQRRHHRQQTAKMDELLRLVRALTASGGNGHG